MHILVTGGAGYIGSHTCVELLNAGYEVTVVDNLYNSSEKALDRVQEIAGKAVKFYKADIQDRDAMNKVFDENKFDAVIHFAGLKAVGESVAKATRNIIRTILAEHLTADRCYATSRMQRTSSSVLPQPYMEIRQSSRSQKSARKEQCTNPYGWTKSPCWSRS